jgi:histidinol dehydrogenase
MLKQYTLQEARATLLRRIPLDDLNLTDSMKEHIMNVFGSLLTPSEAVRVILNDVRLHGDEALRKWSLRLDGLALADFQVPQAEISAALEHLGPAELQAFSSAADRIRRFHQAQPVTSWMTQALGGTLGQLVRPIQRVGIYVPSGSAPLPSSVLMSAIPAQVAGVKDIVIFSPPQRETGKISPVILAAAALVGVSEVYALGGAQAVAAMAYGTATIRPVDKIFGPGNLFVTLAKRQVYGVVGIDSLAGPTETVVIADEAARPDWVAADLLAQAEHDVLASAILLTPSPGLAEAVEVEIEEQLKQRGRAEIIRASFDNRSGIVITNSLEQAVELANLYAPEHLCLAVREPWRWVDQVKAAGGVFLGEHSFEVLGDYIAGPSHVMPTGGSARFASPLNVLDFVHIISLVALDPQTTAQIAPAAAIMARAEGLDAHASAAERRL